jgi:hypothetical protein
LVLWADRDHAAGYSDAALPGQGTPGHRWTGISWSPGALARRDFPAIAAICEALEQDEVATIQATR